VAIPYSRNVHVIIQGHQSSHLHVHAAHSYSQLAAPVVASLFRQPFEISDWLWNDRMPGLMQVGLLSSWLLSGGGFELDTGMVVARIQREKVESDRLCQVIVWRVRAAGL
jgi:hypothetical protein